jgi:ceramide glucosyltransferase
MNGTLLFLAGLSILLNLWQWYAGRRFPLHLRRALPLPLPPLSILKPLKGLDSLTEKCLRSWFEQKYLADVELLFGVASADDPVCGVIRKLALEYPERRSKLIICNPLLGPNGKISSLCHMLPFAAYEHLIISDDDVEIHHGFLEQIAASLTEDVALTSCFYLLRPLNTPMALEAVAVNADFWTQVLQRNHLKSMDFALGAVIGTSRPTLNRIGGFEPLLDYLADDYQLGKRITEAGGKLTICPIPVTCWAEEHGWARVWNHQLRWARTIRVCQPLPYFLSILGNGTLWPLLAALVSPGLAVFSLLVRCFSAKVNYARLTGSDGWIAFALAPVKDLFSAILWALAFAGNTVTWRDQRFRVHRGGKLTPLA